VGDLAVLRSDGTYTQFPGSNPLANRVCGLEDPHHDETAAPEAGEAAFLLITGVAGGVEGGLGQDGSGNDRPNANPCP
jgi:hypothetical protein